MGEKARPRISAIVWAIFLKRRISNLGRVLAVQVRRQGVDRGTSAAQQRYDEQALEIYRGFQHRILPSRTLLRQCFVGD